MKQDNLKSKSKDKASKRQLTKTSGFVAPELCKTPEDFEGKKKRDRLGIRW